MKVQIDINPELLEDSVSVHARALTEKIQHLIKFSQNLDKKEKIQVKKGEKIYLLPVQKIYQLVIENRMLIVKTEKESYQSHLRLYQLMDYLPDDFLQISQSEVINRQQIDYLKLTPGGSIQIVLKNGQITYSSRRYLKIIKERLEL